MKKLAFFYGMLLGILITWIVLLFIYKNDINVLIADHEQEITEMQKMYEEEKLELVEEVVVYVYSITDQFADLPIVAFEPKDGGIFIYTKVDKYGTYEETYVTYKTMLED